MAPVSVRVLLLCPVDGSLCFSYEKLQALDLKPPQQLLQLHHFPTE